MVLCINEGIEFQQTIGTPAKDCDLTLKKYTGLKRRTGVASGWDNSGFCFSASEGKS